MKKSVLMIPALCMMAACSNCAKVEPAKQEAVQPKPTRLEVVTEVAAEEPAPAIVETAVPAVETVTPIVEAATPAARQGNQPREMPSVESIVARVFTFDADGDGKLSFEEFKASEEEALARRRERMGDRYDAAVAEEGLKARFERYDTDADGFLTKEELTAGLAAQREQMRNRPQGQGQGGQGANRQGQGGGNRGGNQGGNRAPRNP